MTSEIAVMNQRAVALAADSAVTLIDGGMVVVRNDQKKLFNLADKHPIGVMFFGVADMMGHPWDHLIEHYQKKVKPKPFAAVRNYAQSFLGMLDNLPEFFPKDKQKDEYRRLLASVFRYVFHLAQYLRDSSSEFNEASDARVLEAAIARVWHDYQFLDDGSARGELACFPKDFATAVARDYSGIANEVIGYGFGAFGISADAIVKLKDISVFAVVKDLFLEDVTGLVFAGYGTDDRYPVVVTCFSSAIIGGIVKRTESSIDAINTEIRSKIRVFADSEVTNAFIRGIDLNLERRMYGTFRSLLHGLVDQLIGAFGDIDPAKREAVRQQFQGEMVPAYFDALRGVMGEYQQNAFINPVLRVLEIAAKAELADTARELVSLNAFKKRIMAQKQTVGGAIDVAVISRDNGFEWVARQSGG